MAIYIGEVRQIIDDTDGGRIKVRLLPSDQYVDDELIAYSFPLLPKFFYVKPKVGESVFVICSDDKTQNSQRYYIGPIISQPQYLNKDSHVISSTSLLRGANKIPDVALSTDPNTEGSFAKDDEVAIYSRKNSDLILSDNDLRLRCGARLFEDAKKTSVKFNRKNPSFIKLKQHDTQFSDGTTSTATITAENINLISTVGDGNFNLADKDEQISDEEMANIIEKAHVLPYGDVLVDFLQMFLQMFKSHTHKYANLPPCPDDASAKLDAKYGSGGITSPLDMMSSPNQVNVSVENVSQTFKSLGDKLLSKHVRIN